MGKKIIVAVILVIGFFMTYLSRVPLAFERGAGWIWSYIPAGDMTAWFLFNLFHVGALIPTALFGVLYVFGKAKWSFHAAAIAQFATTFFLYYDYKASRAEDVISFILFPAITAFLAFVAGGSVFLIEKNLNRKV